MIRPDNSGLFLPLLLAGGLGAAPRPAPSVSQPTDREMEEMIDAVVSGLFADFPKTEQAEAASADEEVHDCDCPEGFCAGKAFADAFEATLAEGLTPGSSAFDTVLRDKVTAVAPAGSTFVIGTPNGDIVGNGLAGEADPLDAVFGATPFFDALHADEDFDEAADLQAEKREVVQSLTEILGSISRMAEEVYGD